MVVKEPTPIFCSILYVRVPEPDGADQERLIFDELVAVAEPDVGAVGVVKSETVEEYEPHNEPSATLDWYLIL